MDTGSIGRSKRLERTDNPIGVVGNRFRVIILSEGLGNLGSVFYYTPESIQSAVPIFEGAKCFADHPEESEAIERPERSIRDIVGHFENVATAQFDDTVKLMADLVLVEGIDYDWARSQLKHALKYSEKYNTQDFIGLSINASGDATETPIDDVIAMAPESCRAKLMEAKSNGTQIINVTTLIDSCISADLVTSAGAGGRAVSILEHSKEKKNMSKQKQVDEKPADGKTADPHTDKDQDVELIKSMIKKYMGDKAASEEEEAEIKKMAAAYKSMGAESMEAAYEAAMKHFKAAKLMKADECKAKEEEAGKLPVADKKDGDKDDKEESEKKEEESEKKESDALRARVAALEEKLLEKELNEHIENVLRESKLSMKATKIFKEGLGKIKTKTDFDKKFNDFKEMYLAVKGELESGLNPEKIVNVDSKPAITFADCVN
jgi:hypothetical protein